MTEISHFPRPVRNALLAALPADAAAQEQHRRECEARGILKMPFEKRRPHLDLIEKVRGRAAREYLEEEIRRQHKLMRERG